ncbi:MAG: flagellar protein export ATPase FliI [Syntrophomonadaceae bacterium]|nr:flagellar protein export ATPase FliI [Syntrophomonadaceae bacterium]
MKNGNLAGPPVQFIRRLKEIDPLRCSGKIAQVIGLTVEAVGLKAAVGELCEIQTLAGGRRISAEVVGFKNKRTLLMPLGSLEGIGPGCQVLSLGRNHEIMAGPYLLGQVLDGLGRPIGGHQFTPDPADSPYSVNNLPPSPLARSRIKDVLATGIKAIDALLTCGKGQRIGIFSGSGIGKSTLLGMIARHSAADVNVIGLIGERGREVLEFLERDLGDGLQKSVVVVATSDQPPLIRIKGAFVATAIAEYFRDQGKSVVLMMDSITRFANAQREVGLAVGEPPTTRGYPPSVFALLPRLLERGGKTKNGAITGLYSVLVEADDMNEPVADAVRGILDGHIVLSRDLAQRNHYPAIDVLASISRLMPELVDAKHRELAGKLRDYLAAYKEAEDLINIGAYEEGSNPRVDTARRFYPSIVSFLQQNINEHFSFQQALVGLKTTIGH